MNIYIGSLSCDITGDDLRAVFAAFGHVETVKINKDKFTGESRGFGFVDMPNRPEAEAAIKGITEIKGRPVTINEARPQTRDGFDVSRHIGFKRHDNSRRERIY